MLQSLPLEVGPDVPNVRRKISGRPKWSVTQWVWGAQGARFMRILSNPRGYSVNSRLHPDPEKNLQVVETKDSNPSCGEQDQLGSLSLWFQHSNMDIVREDLKPRTNQATWKLDDGLDIIRLP